MKRRKSPAKSQQSYPLSQFRIIGGQWRGRKLNFSAVENLRPTPDRVRETLFNWLQPVANLTVLDLFAGSGALGFEALSRGAEHCTFIEGHQQAAQHIQQQITLLNGSATVLAGLLPDALEQLQGKKPFDIIFLDPPYQQQLIQPCLNKLCQMQLVADGAFVYIENASNQPMIELNQHWQVHREKTYGQVRACLLIKQPTKT